MRKEENYPNYSVYIVMGGQLRIPYRSHNRVKIYEYGEAVRAAQNVYKRYNHRSVQWKEMSVVILEYVGAYSCRIKAVISDKGVDNFGSEFPTNG